MHFLETYDSVVPIKRIETDISLERFSLMSIKEKSSQDPEEQPLSSALDSLSIEIELPPFPS